MSDLLQQLSSFLNLSKLVAVTVPGIIATLALVLFTNPPACKTDSQTCWYCQGQQSDTGTSNSKAAAASRAPGTYMVSVLAWEQANQPYKLLASIAKTDLTACAQLPEYIVSSSRLTTDKDTVKNLGDLQAIDAGTLLEELDNCNSALLVSQTALAKRDAPEPTIITALSSSITTLTTALGSARTSVNSVLEHSQASQLEEARRRLEKETQVDSVLKSALTAVTTLTQQISASRISITTDVSTAVPVATPTKTTWQAAAQALGSNILIFLLVSMVVGQLLDPIQRIFISLDPIRGLTFPLLNLLYSEDQPMGAIRFGDQRYRSTRTKEVSILLNKDPHLLEPNYAIGKGLLTQAEYSSLQDQYYSQSQITTGLMLPSLLLALVIYFRLLCCKVVTFSSGGWGGIIWCATATLTLLLFLLSHGVSRLLSEGEEEIKLLDEANTKQRNEEDGKRRSRAARIFTLGPLLYVCAMAVFLVLSYLWLGQWAVAGLAVGLPTLEVICYIAGIDRLHNFYSEVQARIVGAARKQEESQIKKFADILTDPNPKHNFVEELKKRLKEINDVLGPLSHDEPKEPTSGLR